MDQGAFFQIIQLGVGHSTDAIIPFVEWPAIKALANQQGLAAIVLDGIEKLPVRMRPPKAFLLQWIGETLQGYEYRYELCRRTLAEMAGFYRGHGLRIMVLKGYACSLNWPKPEHRPCGDIDIWQFGKQKKADALLVSEKGIQVDNSHHHHSVFYWGDFMVENHYDFINVHHHKSNVKLEKIFKELAQDDSNSEDINGEVIYLPSPNLHALFLLKHTMNDFAAFSMSLRQVLDWGFHVQKQGNEIDWDWLTDVLKENHMMDFFNTINAICVDDLGFPDSIFHNVQCNPELKDRVLKDILYPDFQREEPASLFPRLFYKFKRWKGNGWKHKLCYNESMWSAFWSGIKNHLLRPSSI